MAFTLAGSLAAAAAAKSVDAKSRCLMFISRVKETEFGVGTCGSRLPERGCLLPAPRSPVAHCAPRRTSMWALLRKHVPVFFEAAGRRHPVPGRREPQFLTSLFPTDASRT